MNEQYCFELCAYLAIGADNDRDAKVSGVAFEFDYVAGEKKVARAREFGISRETLYTYAPIR